MSTKKNAVLTYHNSRELKPTDEHEIVVLFLFSLQPEKDVKKGVKPDHNAVFWTETTLSRDLAERGRWVQLSKAEKLKAMFHFAQAHILESGRKLRQAPLFWSLQGHINEGPDEDYTNSKFPKPHAVVFQPGKTRVATDTQSREAAGLLK